MLTEAWSRRRLVYIQKVVWKCGGGEFLSSREGDWIFRGESEISSRK